MKSDLETKLLAVTQAVAEFQTACDHAYDRHRRRLIQEGILNPKTMAQVALQDEVRDITALGTYSAAQCRAVQGAFSAWQPPAPKVVQSFRPTARRGAR